MVNLSPPPPTNTESGGADTGGIIITNGEIPCPAVVPEIVPCCIHLHVDVDPPDREPKKWVQLQLSLSDANWSPDSFVHSLRTPNRMPLQIPTQHMYWTKLTPQTANQCKLYDPRAFSSTHHASSLTARRQGPQPASTAAGTAQDVEGGAKPRGANEVSPPKISHRS